MKAIQICTDESGQPMVWVETPDPSYGPDDVLVDVRAAGVNRADLSQRAGRYPPPRGSSEVLGLEVSGRIQEVGANVTGWKRGDRVCALLPGGGYAERVAVPQGMLMPVPSDWSDEVAAGLPEVFLTAFVNIFMEAGFLPGETVLVHGGASGVGTAAIQLVHHAGGKVIVTAGSEEKVARCRELGADLAINYRAQDFFEAIRASRIPGVDIILDMVGAAYLERNLDLLKPKGRLVFIATLSGTRAEINLGALTGRRLRLIGSTLRGRPLAEKIEIRVALMQRFWPLIEDGSIQPVIDSVYPISQAAEAHQRMAENRNIGKLILRIG